MGRIVWLGHAAFYIEIDNHRILIDPWITNPLSPYRSLDTFTRHFPEIDLVIVTHDHGDHVGETVEILKKYGKARICAVYELAEELAKKAGAIERSIPANIGGPIRFEKLNIILTPAFHSSTIGAPTGVVIVGSKTTIYHAGDTGLFSEMQFIRELYSPTIALLPIGGHFTMGIREAVKAVEILKPRTVIPMHYNTFDVIRADPNEFAKLVKEKVPEANVVILEPGKEITIE